MPTVQQRRTWVVGLIAVVMVTAACSSPSVKTTPHPAPTQVVTTAPPAAAGFTSKRYGFHVALAPGWSGIDAQTAWSGKELQGLESPSFADFRQDASGREFTVGAAPVAAGMQLAAWRAAVVRGARAGCVDPRSVTKTTLGGEPALTWTATCSGAHPTKIVALHGTRGYIAMFELNADNEDPADPRVVQATRRSVESIRQSFHFTG